MDKTDAALSAILTKLDALVSTHAGQAIDLTLRALWWQEIANLMAFPAAALLGYLSYRFFKFAVNNRDDIDWPNTGGMIACIVCGAPAFVFLLAGFIGTHWVTLIDPRLGLALKLIAKAGM